MEVSHIQPIKMPELRRPENWRDDMNWVPGAKEMWFHANRWYSNRDEEGVLDLAPWEHDGEAKKKALAAPDDEVCLHLIAGKGAKKEGLVANCEYFLIGDRLYKRLTWTDVEEPAFMQMVNTYVDMGDTSGAWTKYAYGAARTHLRANPAHGLHLKRGNKTVAIWAGADGRSFFHMELPMEDPNDAEEAGDANWALKSAEDEVGFKKKARGLRINRNKRLIYFVKEVKMTDVVKTAIGAAL